MVTFRGRYNELFDLFAIDAKEYFGASLFGEKTPAHTTFLSELNRNFLQYKKIVLLRDPRDIVCSYFTTWYKQNDASLYNVLLTLKVYMLAIALAVREDDCLQLRYESLTSSPSEEMERVSAFLTIQYSEEILTLHPTTSARGIHKNLAKQVFSNSGKYREKLPAHYIAAIEAVLGDEMLMFGYRHEINPDKYQAFINRYLPIITQANKQLKREAILKDSKNWAPTIKSKMRAFAISSLNYKGSI